MIPPTVPAELAKQVMAHAMIRGNRADAFAALTAAIALPGVDPDNPLPGAGTRPAEPLTARAESRWESEGGQLHA
ncbi:MAG: hypothetical protein ACRDYU_09320 [Actinomycetes bacterium]